MKTYSYYENSRGESVLIVSKDDVRPQAVPMCIAHEAARVVLSPLHTVAMSLLIDWFDGEEDAEMKASCLAVPLSHVLYRRGRTWAVNENELSSLVAALMVTAYENINRNFATCVIEHWGERRDVIRSMMTSGATA